MPVAKSRAMLRVIELADEVAPTPTTVLLLGPSGSGKEVLANRIHYRSLVSRGPWVAVNCAALPADLMEAELFGHEKGAFTGAESSRIGRFEQAQGGTLLLDEISEIPVFLQAKLLRVIQEKEVSRIGGSNTRQLNVRLIATSNKDLKSEVKAGRFRDDLYYRFNVFPISIPPLKERLEELPFLSRNLLERSSKIHNRPIPDISDNAMRALQSYSWPGNVRELSNILERALIRCKNGSIDVEHLGDGFSDVPVRESIWNHVPLHLPSLERLAIMEALRRTDGNRTHAAQLLGIGLRTLRYKLQRFRESESINSFSYNANVSLSDSKGYCQ